jgi:hypothetical protein
MARRVPCRRQGRADRAAGEVPASAPGQGPVAEGQIVFSQDFENGHAGITFSPTNLPPPGRASSTTRWASGAR